MFSSENYSYPLVIDDTIATTNFLEASRGILKFVEGLGKAFVPVKSDIEGNIEKLYKIYHSDESRFITLNAIIDSELESDNKVGIDALLWLKRALEYVHIFLKSLIDDYHNGTKAENLSAYFHKAYDETLRKHHMWLIQNVFKVIVMCAPARKTILLMIANQDEKMPEEEIFKDLENFVNGLTENLTLINNIYLKYNLDPSISS